MRLSRMSNCAIAIYRMALVNLITTQFVKSSSFSGCVGIDTYLFEGLLRLLRFRLHRHLPLATASPTRCLRAGTRRAFLRHFLKHFLPHILLFRLIDAQICAIPLAKSFTDPGSVSFFLHRTGSYWCSAQEAHVWNQR